MPKWALFGGIGAIVLFVGYKLMNRATLSVGADVNFGSPNYPDRNVYTWTPGQGAQPPVAPTMQRPGPPGGFSGQVGQASQAVQTGIVAVDSLLQAGKSFVSAFRN